MPRPKGSKNKKTLAFEANIGDYIAEKLLEQKRLERQIEAVQSEITERSSALNKLRAQHRRVTRDMEALVARRNELDSAASEKAKFMEVEARVADLIGRGISADELLNLLKY